MGAKRQAEIGHQPPLQRIAAIQAALALVAFGLKCAQVGTRAPQALFLRGAAGGQNDQGKKGEGGQDAHGGIITQAGLRV